MDTVMTYLDNIRDHLDAHLLPPAWSIVAEAKGIGDRPPVTVHVNPSTLPELAETLLAWAKTLDDVSAELWRVPSGDSVHLDIIGRLASGVRVRVFGGTDFDDATFPDLPVNQRQEMPVFALRAWIDRGEVAA
ncbi:hypothetical protein HUW46_04103 [Amycolatopsis sp. CA-230715]|nr:hypothetical protein HUW46_04103 [Amycolatopsis sp. CA-230715]